MVGPRSPGPALALAAGVFLWFTAASAIAAVAFALGRPLPAWTAAGALALSLGATALLGRRSGLSWRALGGAAGLVGALLLASGALALAFLDLADDSQTYHLSAALRLARGWNPWRTRLGPADLEYWWCLDHYPRASFVARAALLLAAGRLDLVKIPQLAVLLASGAAAFAALTALLPGRRGAALAVAALAAANPVALVQLATSYVDGVLGGTILALLAGCLLLARAPSPLAAALAFSAAALAAGLKFTGVVYAGCLVAAAGVLALAAGRRASGRVLLAGLGGVAAAVLLLEPDPYLTNLRDHGHPFWPLAGPGARADVGGDEAGEMTPAFAAHGRAARLALSLLARADSLPGQGGGIRLKAPFTVRRSELGAFRGVDARASGFGPLFSGALALAALLFGLLARAHPRAALLGGAAALALLGSALVIPSAWWARYAPQLWLLPLPAVLAALAPRRRDGPAPAERRPGHARAGRVGERMAAALAGTLAANVLLVAAVHFAGQTRGARQHRAQLARLAELSRRHGPIPVAFGRSESHAARLAEHGVRFAEGPLPCPAPVQLLSLNDTVLCPPEPVATVVWP